MKFLIVDDNPEFRKYLRDFIAGENNQFTELDDGLNVNSVYEEFKPDWVLLDIVMKKVNGLKAAKALKKEFPEAHILIISGHYDKKYCEEAKKVGAIAFISKENVFELVEIINNGVTNNNMNKL